jgi:hypothetical protein
VKSVAIVTMGPSLAAATENVPSRPIEADESMIEEEGVTSASMRPLTVLRAERLRVSE